MAKEEEDYNLFTSPMKIITAEDMGLVMDIGRFSSQKNNISQKDNISQRHYSQREGGMDFFNILTDLLPPPELMGPIAQFIPKMLKRVKQGSEPAVPIDLIPEGSKLIGIYKNLGFIEDVITGSRVGNSKGVISTSSTTSTSEKSSSSHSQRDNKVHYSQHEINTPIGHISVKSMYSHT